jgi:hypothetical protein
MFLNYSVFLLSEPFRNAWLMLLAEKNLGIMNRPKEVPRSVNDSNPNGGYKGDYHHITFRSNLMLAQPLYLIRMIFRCIPLADGSSSLTTSSNLSS